MDDEKGAFRPAFTVVTTWAASADEFREKCIRILESYGWKLLEVDRANPVPDNVEFNEEVEDMLERTRSNPKAIIYGTFYSYPVM
jgi:predicted fused transcriptional regulator/phosphomethylpyrimidine kinase